MFKLGILGGDWIQLLIILILWPVKWIKGRKWFQAFSIEKLTRNDVVIISSYEYQEEIIGELKPYGRRDIKIIRLYPEWEYVKY